MSSMAPKVEPFFDIKRPKGIVLLLPLNHHL